MNTFYLQRDVNKTEIKTKFGIVTISNIILDIDVIEKYIPDIIFEDNNLKFVFQQEKLSKYNKSLILKAFIPQNYPSNLKTYISESISHNKTFYSFLAEGMLSLVFRDLFHYNLANAVIDIHNTLTDTHTGADACMFDKNNDVIVLGEAKFYKTLNAGMNKIIADFCKNNISNKINSFRKMIESNEESIQIIIKDLEKNICSEITLDEFLNNKILFGGFVLHGSKDTLESLLTKDYSEFFISSELIKNNIQNNFNNISISADYEIILLHLPIRSKEALIEKVITRAVSELTALNK